MISNIYKKTLIGFLCTVFFLLFFIMGFNYFVDPGNQFFRSATVENKMASALLQNKKVIVQANYNERLLQKILIEKMSMRPDIFVLGSSHIMPLTHHTFHTRRFFNASVSSASLQDDIALYYILQKQGYQPKTLIICLDPWLVSKSSPEILWKSEFIKEYDKGRNLILNRQSGSDLFIQIDSFFEKYSQLLSSDYLEASVHDFISMVRNKKSYFEAQKINILSKHAAVCSNCFIRQPDGARLPTPNEELTTTNQADTYVMNNLNNWQTFWSQSKLDNDKAILFEAFIHLLIKNNVNVVFYFPPLEPLEYKQLVKKNKNYQMVLIAQQYFDSIAEKHHLQVIGSYDPGQANVTTKDFIDNWHLKEEGVQKLFLSENL